MDAVLPLRRRRSQSSIRSPSVKRDSHSQVVIESWLYKLEGAAPLKQWKHRWCVLADFCLFFYKGPNEEKAEHHNMKTYYFAAESTESMHKWMNAMSLATVMQNVAGSGKLETTLSSVTNDDEDSGFTSYRPRRFRSHDHNSSYDRRQDSDSLNQRSQSCGDRMGEIYLSNDDKYPNIYKGAQELTYASSPAQNIPNRQPLYANAPPKPRRLTMNDPYAISPSERYDSTRYDTSANPNSYQDQSYPDMNSYTSNHVDNFASSEILIANHYNSEMIFPDMLPDQYCTSYHYSDNFDGLNNVGKLPSQPPRPHSADFLERDAENYPVEPQRYNEKSQPQRPKSSLEYYDKYWNSEEYNFDDYREAVRTQADNLYTNKNLYSNKSKHAKKYAKSYPKLHLKYPNKISSTNESVENQIYPDYYYNKNYQMPYSPYYNNSNKSVEQNMYTKKSKAREESMKRLLEWKQRMLQSPLTKRSLQHSTSSSETNSPRHAPTRPPLPNEYRKQVMQELESHEARLRNHDIYYLSQNKCRNEKVTSNTANMNSKMYNYSAPSFNYEKSAWSDDKNTHHPVKTKTPNDSMYASDHIASSTEMLPTHTNDHSDAKVSNEPEKKVIYCVDSENNEILICGDNYASDISDKQIENNFQEDNRYQFNQIAKKSKAGWLDNKSHVNEKDSFHQSSMQDSSFQSSEITFVSQDSALTMSSNQRVNTSYSSDDEASVDTDNKYKRGNKNKASLSKRKNVSDSEIHMREPNHLKRLVQQSEGLMNKGKRLSISAGDLLGKTHEELVLLLIQLRRNQARIARAKEKCLQQLEKHFSKMDERMQQAYNFNGNELKKQISQLEKQYEATRPLVNLVDNMVKLGSMYGSSESRSSSFPYLVESSENLDSCKMEESVFEMKHASSPETENTQLQGHLKEIYSLDKGLRHETYSFSSLQQDKEMLEHTLSGMKSKIVNHQDQPIELQKLRKQQRLIEKELSRVKRLLNHSARKIEDATTKNDKLEQEILLLRQKLQQALRTGSPEMQSSSQSRADLEAELTRVQDVLEELANHRQEINTTVEKLKNEARSKAALSSTKIRASPTGVAGSAPLPLRKKTHSTYLETNLDTMETCDLSTIGRDADDIPVYVNAEEINHPTTENAICGDEPSESAPSKVLPNENDEGIQECPLQDINDADDRMKRFYGIIPREKPCEIKTVRIVKRQSERRNRERDKKRVTYGEQSSVWLIDEPDLSSEDQLDADDECFNKDATCSRPSTLPVNSSHLQRQSGAQSAHLQLFGDSSKQTKKEDNERSVQQDINSTSPLKRQKRRHYTVTGCQYPSDPQFSNYLRDKPRSRDDVDMERCLRTANTPDIVRSTIKKNEVFDDSVIDRELGLPQKISIPERYIEDEPEQLSASERLRRNLKAENIRKMLSETTATYDDVQERTGEPPGSLHKKLSEEKHKRAQLLALNQVLAREVMERSKAVAANVYSPDSQAPQ